MSTLPARIADTRRKPAAPSTHRVGGAPLAVILALAVFPLGACSGEPATPETGTLHTLEGSVEVLAGSDEPTTALDGRRLSAGDTIRTGSDGRAEIIWFEGSVTRLDHDTTFAIVTLESRRDGTVLIEGEQATGNTYHRVTGLIETGSRFAVITPTAVAGVQGTEYGVFVEDDGSTLLAVTDQTVTVAALGGEVAVAAGLALRVPAGAGTFDEIGPPGPIPDEIRLGDWLTYNTRILPDTPPQIQANLTDDTITAHGWTIGVPATVTIYRSDTDEPITRHPTPGEHGFFALDPEATGLAEGLQPGMRIVVTDGDRPAVSHELTLVPSRFESFDAASATVSGWAPVLPIGEVRLHLRDGEGRFLTTIDDQPIPLRPAAGYWSFDLRRSDPPQAPSGLLDAAFEVPDDDNDGTFASLPSITALVAWPGSQPGESRIESGHFDDDRSVTVEIIQPGGDRTVVVVPVSERGEFALERSLAGGVEIVVTGDDTGLTKHLVVDPLAVTRIDRDSAVVEGTASPFAVLRIDVGDDVSAHEMIVRADADGHWIAHFDGFEFTVGMGGRVRTIDPDTDATAVFFEV